MLEEWVWDADSLSKFARNAQGETIPAELVERLNAGRDFGQGLFVRHEMFYAALSLNLYNRDPEGLNLTDTERELQTKYSPFPYVEDTYFHTSFGHLYGYSAIYYTYMWTLVIAQDMFSEFDEQVLINPEMAHGYRSKGSAPGDNHDDADPVEDILSRPYSFDIFEER